MTDVMTKSMKIQAVLVMLLGLFGMSISLAFISCNILLILLFGFFFIIFILAVFSLTIWKDGQ